MKKNHDLQTVGENTRFAFFFKSAVRACKQETDIWTLCAYMKALACPNPNSNTYFKNTSTLS